MAARLGYLPAQFITEIVGTVAFPVYAQLQKDREKVTNMYRKMLLATTMLMLPVCAVFAYLAPALITDVLGERWQGAATVMQLVILSSVIGILGDGVAPMLKGKGQPAKIATMDFLQLVVLSATAWALVSHFGLEGAGIALTISVLAPQFLAIRYAHQLLDKPFMGIGAALLAIAVTTVAATLTAGAFLNAISDLPGILLAGAASLLVAAVVILGLDSRFNLGLREDLAISFPWMRRLGTRQSARD
jgi:O-antigen/teichoic acid export membrane protein